MLAAMSVRRLVRLVVVVSLLSVCIGAGTAAARDGVSAAKAAELSAPVKSSRSFHLPRAATHVAVYWRGSASARVLLRLSRADRSFGPWRRVRLDEVGERRRDGRTYGSLVLARGARVVRVATDRPLRRVWVLAITDRGRPADGIGIASVSQPRVISRAEWGADESLMTWAPVFQVTQKLIVHHTATQNDDPDGAATIRAIYRYHAVTQGWGDIGYNFLIDEAGNVYEGRYSRAYPAGTSPTGDDEFGRGVTAAHAAGFNSGTVGVALLGTLTTRDATPAARDALERFLAWETERNGIDPLGSALYVNPVNGTEKVFPNVAGHRDVNSTECPGDRLYAALPSIRSRAAQLISGDTTPPASPAGLIASPGSRQITLDWADNAETDLAGYRLERRIGNRAWSIRADVSPSTFTDTSLKPGTTYRYRVSAYDRNGNYSPPSAEVAAVPTR
jgi:hypothetical protein